MSIKVRTTKDAIQDNGVKILLYGSSGQGKTHQAKHLGKVLLLSAEKGDLTLNDVDVDSIHINNSGELKEAYLYAEENKDKYDTIILDSLTEIGEMIVQELKDSGNYDSKDTFKMWGDFTTIITKIAKSFRDLNGVNIILLALEESVKNGFDEKLFPSIPAVKAKKKLISLYDEVYRIITNDDGTRSVICHSINECECKHRSPIKINSIEPLVYSNEQTTDAGLGILVKKFGYKFKDEK